MNKPRISSIVSSMMIIVLIGLTGFPTPVQAEDPIPNWELVYTFPGDQVQALQEFGDFLYAGGSFGQGNAYLYRLDGNTNTWSDLNISTSVGYQIDLLQAMAVMDNRLFIGSRSIINGQCSATVYSSLDGSTFKLELSLPASCWYSGIEDLLVDQETLYASNGSPNSEVWKRDLSGNWSRLGNAGEPGYEARTMTIYDGLLYVGTGAGSGAKLWNWNGEVWSLVKDFGGDGILSLASFEGKLYFAFANGSPRMPVMAFDGSTWEQSTTSCNAGRLELIADSLWLGTCNGEVQRLSGNTWIPMGNIAADYAWSFSEYKNYIYAGTLYQGGIFRIPSPAQKVLTAPYTMSKFTILRDPPEKTPIKMALHGFNQIIQSQGDRETGKIGYEIVAWGGLVMFYNTFVNDKHNPPSEQIYIQSLMGTDYVIPSSGLYKITAEIELHGMARTAAGEGLTDFLIELIPGIPGKIFNFANPAKLLPKVVKCENVALLIVESSETRDTLSFDSLTADTLMPGMDESTVNYNKTIQIETQIQLNAGDTISILAGLETSIDAWGNAGANVKPLDSILKKIVIEKK